MGRIFSLREGCTVIIFFVLFCLLPSETWASKLSSSEQTASISARVDLTDLMKGEIAQDSTVRTVGEILPGKNIKVQVVIMGYSHSLMASEKVRVEEWKGMVKIATQRGMTDGQGKLETSFGAMEKGNYSFKVFDETYLEQFGRVIKIDEEPKVVVGTSLVFNIFNRIFQSTVIE